MPSLNRTTILTGPALVTFGGQSFWSKGDVTVNLAPALFSIQTAHFGEIDKRVSDRMIEVSFEPSGAFTAGLAAVLWPYAVTAIGSSIYGANDRALVVWTRDGKKLTIHNASITGMPTIRTGVSKTIQGSMKFTGLLANNTDPSNAAAYFTLANAAYPGDTGFNVADIKTLAYASAWGESPWDSFQTEDGWEIAFGLELTPQKVDGLGTIDMTLKGLKVTAKAIPVGVSEADIMAKAMPAVSLGNSIAAASSPLNIYGTGVYVRVYNAGITDSGFVYGSDKKRVGATTWEATRSVTGGAADPLYFIGTSSPA